MMVNGGKEIVPNGIEEGTATYTEIFFFKSGTTKTSGCGRLCSPNALFYAAAFLCSAELLRDSSGDGLQRPSQLRCGGKRALKNPDTSYSSE